MGNPADRDVDALVQRIIAEADGPRSPAVDLLRARVAALSPAQQAALDERLRRAKVPILAYGGPEGGGDTSGSPGIDRRSSTAGA